MNDSTLEAVIVAYLRSQGFYETFNGWGHRTLGGGRTFVDVVRWAIGCEKEGRDLAAEAKVTY